MERLQDNDACFVCGDRNPAGLAVTFDIDRSERTIRAVFQPRDHHQGFANIVHGGVLAALLDEAMVKLAFCLGMNAVTAEMTVSFKEPASPGDLLSLSGRIVQETGRLVLAEAAVKRGPAIIASATGKLLKIKERGQKTDQQRTD